MKHRLTKMRQLGVANPDGHVIGLDLGATAVRAAVLAQGTLEGRPSVTIHGVGRADLPGGAMSDGVVQEPAKVTAALKQLWSQSKFDCRNVVLGIANSQVMVRDMTIPKLEPEQLAKALPFLAKDIVALPLDQAILDFCPLEFPADDATSVRGLLVASPREPVLTAVRAVEKAGLRVARVDLASLGALRAIGAETLSVEAVIDIGAHLTTIVIHDRGVPKLVRTITKGGQSLTEQIADKLGFDGAEAEQAKCENGLDGTHDEVVRATVEAVRPLFAEIRTSLGYFRSNTAANVERISLTGGSAALRGIAPALADQLGIPVRIVDPLQHVRNRLASRERQSGVEQPPTAVAVGLAMGAAA